jgi:hypothetical protein
VPSELLATAVLANCGRDAPQREFMESVATEVPGVAVFQQQPRPGGNLEIKAAVDWQAVLGTAADLLAFAGLIWAAYERYVKPRREKHRGGQKPLLFLQVSSLDGSFVQFSLGSEVTDKQVFIEQFVREVTELRAQESPDGEQVLTAISKNESWVRIGIRGERGS